MFKINDIVLYNNVEGIVKGIGTELGPDYVSVRFELDDLAPAFNRQIPAKLLTLKPKTEIRDSDPVIDLDNIVTLVRVYFCGNTSGHDREKISAKIRNAISSYDEKYEINFDQEACTNEVLKQLK